MGVAVGNKVRELRRQRGWTQGQLLVQARRYAPEGKKLARETMSRIENGQPHVDFWIIEALAKALGVNPAELVGDEPIETKPVDPALGALVTRVDGLSPALRDAVTRILEGVLALIDVDGGGETAELDEFGQRLVRLLDHLPPERRAYWQQEIETEAADLESHAAEQTG